MEPQMNTGAASPHAQIGSKSQEAKQIRANIMNEEREFFHKELTKDILDSAFKVHNALGCGLLEKVYGNALSWDLEFKNRVIAKQQEFRVLYRDKEVGIYYADIVVDGKVIVEVKSVERLDDVHRAQLLNYLRLSGIKVGLLINF